MKSSETSAIPPNPVLGTESALSLWYNQPADTAINEALPIGNGRLGGLICGGTAEDAIPFNEDSLWTGDSNPTGNYDTMGAYQAFGAVKVQLNEADRITGYRRDLDISQAIAHVSYFAGGVSYTREYFCSYPDQVLAARYTCDQDASYSGTIELTDAHGASALAAGNTITVTGQLSNGMQYAAQLAVLHDGGTVRTVPEGLTFDGCNSITLLLAAGTSYVMDFSRGYEGDSPLGRVESQIRSASQKKFDTLESDHVKDYQSLFNRVMVSFGHSSPAQQSMPTDERKAAAAAGNDPEFEALLFQYGRYLLISSSRPGSLPANLQGLWNDSNTPPWNSDYHTNINIEMNYWPAEVANLSECAQPLFDLVDSQIPSWRVETAAAPDFKLASGAPVRGWAVRTSHNITGGMGWNWDKTADAWYCQLFWEHYAFTGDTNFLRNTAYPVLKETCQFWEDHLKTLPDGRLVVPNGWSPEHGPTEDGVSYNQEIVWDLFTNYIDASDALKIDGDYRGKIFALRDKLVVPKIGKWGQLQEWMEDIDDPNDHHRHTSQLFGVYPGRQFTMDNTPDMMAAARVSLIARGDTGDVREWSYAWRAALFARMLDGDKAQDQIDHFLTNQDSCPNLFGLHPPMQIDGNFGVTAAMAEMLVQSHEGDIVLLPALPTAWPTGYVLGLRARGGFIVDISWEFGKLASVVVHSTKGSPCTIRYGNQSVQLNLKSGQGEQLGSGLNEELSDSATH